MPSSTKSRKRQRRKKRTIPDLIDVFYEYIKNHDEIFLSAFRKIEDPGKRISSPTDRNLLEIIRAIQDREYIYVKKDGRYTKLKASSRPRDQKHRFVQLYDQIKFIRNEKDKLDISVENAKKRNNINDYQLVIGDYQNVIENIIHKLELVNTTEEVPTPEGFD